MLLDLLAACCIAARLGCRACNDPSCFENPRADRAAGDRGMFPEELLCGALRCLRFAMATAYFAMRFGRRHESKREVKN